MTRTTRHAEGSFTVKFRTGTRQRRRIAVWIGEGDAEGDERACASGRHSDACIAQRMLEVLARNGSVLCVGVAQNGGASAIAAQLLLSGDGAVRVAAEPLVSGLYSNRVDSTDCAYAVGGGGGVHRRPRTIHNLAGFSLALRIGGHGSITASAFDAACDRANVPLWTPDNADFDIDISLVPCLCSPVASNMDDVEYSDCDSSTAVARTLSPGPSLDLPTLDAKSPLYHAQAFDPIDIDSEIANATLRPPKDAGFSCTSFIPPPLETSNTPSLTIVGAGPGTPALLTISAIIAIQSCSLLIVDRLVPADLIKYALTVQIAPLDSTSPRTSVGTMKGSCNSISRCSFPYLLHTRKVLGNAPETQKEIEDWTAAALRLGHSVVRLKGGDPFVYGRGGEEYLSAARCQSSPDTPSATPSSTVPPAPSSSWNINVIPGLSSSLVAPLMAGIPSTHRGVADQILIATGRLEEEDKDVEWPPYAPHRTTVVLMAMGRIQRCVRGMVEESGYPLDLPVAIVEKAGWGAEAGERVWRGTLGTVVQAVKDLGMKAHATLVIGRVVHALLVS
ncbi:tetrapyrrole methylase [Chytriomyces sp. MP71]|nr:tetrapyrrole methylase [Chytriomyces sp. MP71]